ncbi:protein anon-73B1 [Lycorma delicatula]|uniref:protein anon-73B1 n=1 Tax=Lycorma delicatula TaxID=130591 RepID=UPI003F51406A
MEATVQTEDLMDSVIRCGLYLGAIFQLVCIAAVVILPERTTDGSASCLKDGDVSDDEGSEGSPHATPRRPHAHHRTRKQEKKKRR